MSNAAQETIELAESAGLVLDSWQKMVLKGTLGERADGKWAATQVGLLVARQNGKGAILEARELAGLFLFGEKLLTHTAHRVDTCLEHFKRLRFLVENTPDLLRKVRRIREANGNEGFDLRSGARLNFKARSKGAGRGFSGDFVAFDEAMWLWGMDSLLPTMSARPNPQVWFTGSAPLPRQESLVWCELVKDGRAGELDAYFEWSNPVGASIDDERALEAVNPGLDVRLSRQFIHNVERKRMTEEEFARERFSIFELPSDEDESWSVIPADAWGRGRLKLEVRNASFMANPVTFGIDATPNRDFASIGAAGAFSDGRTAVEVVEHRGGVAWVVDRAVELNEKHSPKAWLVDPRSPAGSMIRDLEARGLKITPCDTAELAKATGDFFDDVVERGGVLHRGQPELDAAVAGATKRTVGDAWLWDRRAGTVICPLVSVTLAHRGHREIEAPVPEADFILI